MFDASFKALILAIILSNFVRAQVPPIPPAPSDHLAYFVPFKTYYGLPKFCTNNLDVINLQTEYDICHIKSIKQWSITIDELVSKFLFL